MDSLNKELNQIVRALESSQSDLNDEDLSGKQNQGLVGVWGETSKETD